jgi:hypothetical protein
MWVWFGSCRGEHTLTGGFFLPWKIHPSPRSFICLWGASVPPPPSGSLANGLRHTIASLAGGLVVSKVAKDSLVLVVCSWIARGGVSCPIRSCLCGGETVLSIMTWSDPGVCTEGCFSFPFLSSSPLVSLFARSLFVIRWGFPGPSGLPSVVPVLFGSLLDGRFPILPC